MIYISGVWISINYVLGVWIERSDNSIKGLDSSSEAPAAFLGRPVRAWGFGVWGFWVLGLGFWIWIWGFGVLGFGVLGFGVLGVGFWGLIIEFVPSGFLTISIFTEHYNGQIFMILTNILC